MREKLKTTIRDRIDRPGKDLEPSNVRDGALYLPLVIPLMAVDYATERLGCDTDVAVRVLDFLRYKCHITTAKSSQ